MVHAYSLSVPICDLIRQNQSYGAWWQQILFFILNTKVSNYIYKFNSIYKLPSWSAFPCCSSKPLWQSVWVVLDQIDCQTGLVIAVYIAVQFEALNKDLWYKFPLNSWMARMQPYVHIRTPSHFIFKTTHPCLPLFEPTWHNQHQIKTI